MALPFTVSDYYTVVFTAVASDGTESSPAFWEWSF